MKSIFVSDLHGREEHYEKLFQYIINKKPEAVFMGGDLLPNYHMVHLPEFINDYLKVSLTALKNELKEDYPNIIAILGNDDPAYTVPLFEGLNNIGLLKYLQNTIVTVSGYQTAGHPYVPPTPFMLKDWEKYDVSRYVPRESVSPEEGIRTVDVPENIRKYSTIASDLNVLSREITDFKKSIFIFHSPPYETNLDKMIGRDITGNKVLVSTGSIAIKRFIEKYQPLVTLHGHIHESSELSGSWQDTVGETKCYTAAFAGNELSIISFDTEHLEDSVRDLI
jgi:Icc-related predicted phosphoesterase